MLDIAGWIDECRPDHEVGFVDGRPILLPRDRIRIRGWVRSSDDSPFTLELSADECKFTIPRNVPRPDVSMHPRSMHCGFDVTFDVPRPVDPKRISVSVAAALPGKRIAIGSPIKFALATDPKPILHQFERSAEPTRFGRFRRIVDSDPRHLQHGWSGRRAIRSNSAIAVSGWILDTERRPPIRVYLIVEGEGGCFELDTALVEDGEATAVAGGSEWFKAGFECVASPWIIKEGLYRITAVAVDRYGHHVRGPSEAFQITTEGEEERQLPTFLRLGAVELADEETDVGPLDLVRGTPVVVRGAAIDPSTGAPAAVYVRFGDGRPLPVPPAGAGGRRFAGIADTNDLVPGIHRLQVLLQPAYAGFWHLVAERTVTVRPNASAVAPDGEEMVVDRQSV